MKSLLIIAAISIMSGSVYAQSFEVGVNGGVSTTAKPHQSLYQGDDNVWNYAADVNVHYNISERWQTGLSIGLTKWERTGEWPLTGTSGTDLGSEDVKFIFAERAVSFAFQLNHVIPFYEQYEDFVRSHLYFGIAAGAVVLGNDGTIQYSKVNPNTPVEYTYTSEFHFENGYGFLLGAQLGYTYYFGEHLGINLEVAPKVAWVKTNDARYAGANNVFNIIYFPTTIGVHYRFGYNNSNF